MRGAIPKIAGSNAADIAAALLCVGDGAALLRLGAPVCEVSWDEVREEGHEWVPKIITSAVKRCLWNEYARGF